MSDSVPAPQNPSPSAQEINSLAAMTGAGNYAQATALAEAMTRRYPSHGLGWKALGALLKAMGRDADAIDAMRKAAAYSPNDAQAHYNLGILLREAQRLAPAEAAYRRALELNPDYAEAHYNLGNLLREARRPHEAEAAYRRVLELRPGDANAHYNLGVLFAETRRLADAEAGFLRVLAVNPDDADAHNNLGNLFRDTQRLPEAEAAFVRALELRPDRAESHYNLANLLREAGRLPAAEAAYRRAIELEPGYAGAYNNLGNLLRETGRLADAEAAYRRTLVLQPDNAGAHNNLANLLKDTDRRAEAEATYRRALALKPDYAEVHSNLGSLLKDSGRLPEAEAAYRSAIAQNPGYADGHNNLAVLLHKTGRHGEAETAYRRALELKPDFAEAGLNFGMLLLGLGRYSEAWPWYESRYDPKVGNTARPLPVLPCPPWRGEPLAGKSLLIVPEQGFGDLIQFVRYASLLKAAGVSRLTLVCDPSLQALLQTAQGFDAVVTDIASISAHDYWSFALSLPLYFETTLQNIPATLPYLRALPERIKRWRDRLPASRPRVGLVWQGSPTHGNDAYRSLPGLVTMAPLWSVQGVSFFSLQKGAGEEQASQELPGQPLVSLGPDILDFADSAAIVKQLDLVICVDTAIAHLAGALAKPCWILLPAYSTDWRWLTEGEESPWYPGVVRLFRQSRSGDWDQTLAEVARALDDWVRGK